MTNTETMSRPIRNIHALNRAIHELKDRQKELEGKLEQNFQHLSGNYMSMGMNSLFGGKKARSNFWADLATRVMESEKLQTGVGNLVGKLADKVGEAFSKNS
ncbi:MAG: hypothetical protein RLY85_1771 [Bacteroidota bacterium]|jgi:predicted phage-related endonuclease